MSGFFYFLVYFLSYLCSLSVAFWCIKYIHWLLYVSLKQLNHSQPPQENQVGRWVRKNWLQKHQVQWVVPLVICWPLFYDNNHWLILTHCQFLTSLNMRIKQNKLDNKYYPVVPNSFVLYVHGLTIFLDFKRHVIGVALRLHEDKPLSKHWLVRQREAHVHDA